MPVEVTMPRLSDTMEQGTVVSWNVAEGDEVSAGDVLGDIETDKATMELQNFDDGVVAAILLNPGDTVEVGKTILVIAEEGEDADSVKSTFAAGAGAQAAPAEQAAAANGDPDTSAAATATAEANGSTASTPGSADDGAGGRIYASPLARKIAQEHNLDLGTLTGSGPGGRIVRADVEAAVAAPQPDTRPAAKTPGVEPMPFPMPDYRPALEDRTVQLSNMRRTIAHRLLDSTQSVPHYYMTVEILMDELLALRKQLNEQLEPQGIKLTVNDFIVRACALAMHEHPFLNSTWNDKGGNNATIEVQGHVNIGVAIALEKEEGGLVVATVRDADRLGLRQISHEVRRLAKKARNKGLTIEEMSDATFTISNLGMFGVHHYTAIINPPNAAILAVGAAHARPIVNKDGEIVPGHVMSVTMSGDHRIVDGAMVAQYLQTLRRYLEAPATLLV